MELIKYAWSLLIVAAVNARHAYERQASLYPSQHCDVICNEEHITDAVSICGTDGVLYKSKCDYNNALCKARQNGTTLRYASMGPECVTDTTTCDVLAHTTCVNFHSPYYINPGGFPGHPIDYPINIGGGFNLASGSQAQVCGSDGKTYGSKCALRQANCKMQTLGNGTVLELDHTGPCQTTMSGNYTELDCSKYVVDLHGLALEGGSHTTLRVTPCYGLHSPVCALNGRTYSSGCSYCGILAARHQIQNHCELEKGMCLATANGTRLRVVNYGDVCVTLSSDCDDVKSASCIHYTSQKTQPICASDGKTYDTICIFMSAKCFSRNRNLTMNFSGECPIQLTNETREVDCSQYVIDYTGLALESDSHPYLRVVPCPSHTNQTVCAFDDRTYASECDYCGHLVHRHQIDVGNLTTHIKHKGRCYHSG